MKNIVIIPTYNERENIGIIIPSIFEIVPEIHIMVVDDNSPDQTAEVVKDLQQNYPNLSLILRPEKKGLGPAYLHAFDHVLQDPDVRTVIMMDADLSHQPKYLPEMLEKSYTYSVVIGSRYVKGGATLGWELWRRLLSFFGNLYCRLITRMPIRDNTSGFNVIHAELLRKIDLTKISMSGYAFIMESKHAFYKAGATFFEVPIIFVNRIGGESKISGHVIHEGILAPWKIISKK